MRKKLFTLLLVVTASLGTLFAWDYEHVQIGDLYYNLDATNKMAEVTSQYSSYPYWSATITTADIPMSVFYNSVTYSVTSIGKDAFYNCNGLTSVTIPNSVTTIGSYAFYNVLNIAYNGTATGSPWGARSVNGYVDGYFVYSDATKTELIKCSAAIEGGADIPSGVKKIGESAFSNCSGLTSVTIPNSVTSIGYNAFSDCNGLKVVHISDMAAWCKISFGSSAANPLYYAHNLYLNGALITDLVIPNSVTSIGNYAFSNCSGLTSVTIPNSVTSIGSDAFRGCSGLKSVTIPNSVTSIGSGAFYNCTGLTTNTIPNSVTKIGRDAFYDVLNIVYSGKATGSPWGAKSVNGYVDGYFVYSDATKTNLLGCLSNIEGEVTIPNTVKSIGQNAFRGCKGITSVTIPNSVTSIGSSAFGYCGSLKEVHISDMAAWCRISFGSYNANPLDYAHDLYLNGLLITDLVIPNSVTSIGNYAFYDCSGLTSVTIPNSVTSIGSYAFSGCSGLTSVTIPNSVTSIGESAFYGCSGLKEVHISDMAAWCRISFGSYNANPLDYAHDLYLNGLLITDLVIPNSVMSIGNYAFYNCSGLTSVTIPNSVTSIGEDAFYGCSGLKEVHISDLATWCKIGFGSYFANPLYYAHNLYLNGSLITDLVIPNSVTSIGNYAFYGCSGLTSVTIPNSVTSIGNYAFYNCSGLKYIISLPNTPPTIKSYTIPTGVTIYVYNEALNSYQNAINWKDYSLRGLIDSENTEAPTSAVISMTNNAWSLNGNYIVSCGIEGGEMFSGNTLEYIGLEPNSEYTDVPIVLTSNTSENMTVNLSFTTSALTLTTQPSKPVSSNTAILLAETNMADIETSCGFEYKRNDAPADMEGNKVFCPVASGQMAGRLKNLKDDVYYKYRAFYQSAAGNMYYGDWQYIFTGDVAVEFDPILYTYGATVVKENEATISGYALAGSEDFTEQGFEYWAETRANGGANAPHRVPAALNEHFFVQASGIALHATLTNLDAGTVYKYRVYGKVGDQYYYGAEQSFATQGEYEGDDSEAIEEVPSDQVPSTKAQKILRNGQIFILRGEKVYTLQGQEVK